MIGRGAKGKIVASVGLTMTRLARRQTFIFILISLLVYGLIWCGLLSNVGEPNQVKELSFDPFRESPLHNRGNYPAPSPLWQANQINIAFLQSVTVISLNRVLTKSTGNVQSALYHWYQNTDFGSATISLRIIDTFNTAFKFVDGQAYLHLDIPPPHVLASL
jgi:hypothetical protein